MNPSKYPISTALTSFNAETAAPVIEAAKKSATKVHHLPPSIWKKMVGDAQSPLDKAIERTRDFFSNQNCVVAERLCPSSYDRRACIRHVG